MGHRNKTRTTPPKKETIPRILSFLEKNRSVLDGPVKKKDQFWVSNKKIKVDNPISFEDLPIVNVKPMRNKTSPSANKAESKKNNIPKTKNTIPYSISSSKIDTKDKIFSHKSNHASAQTLSEQLTRAKSPVPIFALSLIMWEELSSNFNVFFVKGG